MAPTSFVQANTNGRLHDATEPSLSPLDRGFLYGDAIYEVWRTYNGVLFAWVQHLERLDRSAAALSLVVPWPRDRIRDEICRTASAFRSASGWAGELYIRLQISRGRGSIGLDPGLADEPRFVILVQALRDLSPEARRDGLRLSLSTTLRRNPAESLNPAWKTGNYLNNILCLREARARGADEVIMLNLRGEIAEAAVSNVGFVRGGTLITPRLDSGILAGVTRGLLLGGIAAEAAVSAAEGVVRPEDLPGMDECLLFSTTRDVVPVGAIDGRRFRVGPDTVTSRLKAAFEAHARRYAADHPELGL